jgi:hypothetical protein
MSCTRPAECYAMTAPSHNDLLTKISNVGFWVTLHYGDRSLLAVSSSLLNELSY